MRTYDTIIIGAGPGGYELAVRLVQRGEKVAVIERDRLGGTCLNRGCIPTKCLCATAETAVVAEHAAQFGIETTSVTVNFEKAAERMHSVVNELREGVASVLSGAELIEGEAVLAQGNRVIVGDSQYSAPRIVIATGSKPARLSIPGAELAITSDELLTLTSLPESAVIIGGGVIGMEFASILSALGTEVTVVEYCKEILPPFDPEIARRLRTALTRRGIKIVTGASVKTISRVSGLLRVEWEGKRGSGFAEADQVIMAVGRRPVVPEGCADAGVNIDSKGFIITDEKMATSAQGIYAIGDVNGRCMLAHAAVAQGNVVFDPEQYSFDTSRVPSVVFTLPEAASVGALPAQLDMNGTEYAVSKATYAANGKAQAMGQTDGMVKIIYAPSTGKVLGVSAVGAHASDLIAEASLLIGTGMTVSDFNRTVISAHPTLSEILARALDVHF